MTRDSPFYTQISRFAIKYRSLLGQTMALLLLYLCKGLLWITLLICLCVIYACIVDAQRQDDDPQKRNYQIGAIVLALFTWPFLLIFFISIFLLRVFFYGFFLAVFTIALLFLPRGSYQLSRLEKTAARIGDLLLQANTLLIRIFLRPWSEEPETT